MHRLLTATLVAAVVSATHAQDLRHRMIGMNVCLNRPADEAILADLGQHGEVLDLIPEINALTLRASISELPAIQALPCVAGANVDRPRFLAGNDGVPIPDFADGANLWNLDAINLTEFGSGRTVAYDGQGVYVAVIDTGLPQNWRAYFPEERISSQFARCFGGGGGDRGSISQEPGKWEHDTNGHGTWVTSVILGFQYLLAEPPLPQFFNGVAPRATVIPVRTATHKINEIWSSVATRALVYVTTLKTSGALGDAPLVVNLSLFGQDPDFIERAAIDHAIANGVVIVAGAGLDGDSALRYPAAYPPVVSTVAAGWVREFPQDDPSRIVWTVRDVPENDPSEYFTGLVSPLPGEDLDVAAPGFAIAAAWTKNGKVDYTFGGGASFACPHVTGVAALMLQKNPALTQSQVEAIIEASAMPLPPSCRDARFPENPGVKRPWSVGYDVILSGTFCWEAPAAGAGLLQADAALAATPLP